ncbi:LolA family protein [Clostridium thailandense]|uniref:LolA family protein n=1 Tax=Clostridium thailandense TaxID=2794346 RepID=UPI0039891873
MKKKLITVLAGTAFTLSLFTGCSIKKDTIIPEEIITNVMKASEKSKSYYGESRLETYENGKLKDSITIKEWVNNSTGNVKKRVETEDKASGKVVTTSNGDKLLIYIENEKKALTMKLENELAGTYSMSYKDQLINQLGNIAKTHQITFKGEENIEGFKTYHLSAVPKENNSIIGNQDYWIDKEHWFLIKSSLESGNIKSISEYTKLDFSPKLEDSLFIQKLPSDVKIEDMDQVGKNNEKVIDLKEGVKIAGKSILCLKESSDYKLKTVTYLDAKAISHKEINQNYEKNGVLAFTLTTILNDNKDSKDDEDKLPGEKDITVRGIKGTVMEDIKCISWTENNLKYNVLIQDPNLKLEDWKKIVESLTLTN